MIEEKLALFLLLCIRVDSQNETIPEWSLFDYLTQTDHENNLSTFDLRTGAHRVRPSSR